MMYKKITQTSFLIVVMAVVFGMTTASAQNPKNGVAGNFDVRVRLDQKLGAQIPPQLAFKDETGKDVHISDYFGRKPLLLALIFYRCQGSCTEVLNGMTKTFVKGKFDIGKDFDVVVVSIADKEGPALAKAKKETYLDDLTYGRNREAKRDVKDQTGRAEAAQGWHFLTGTRANIDKLADTIGYRFIYDAQKDTYNHPAGMMVVTPSGKVSRYFYGFNYQPPDVRTSLADAAANRIGKKVEEVFFGCMVWNPNTGKYTMNVIRALQVAGIGTFLILATSIAVMSFKHRYKAITPAEIAEKRNSGMHA